MLYPGVHPALKWTHLEGFPYEAGTNDCFQLMRRFYFDNWGIEIADYAYSPDWWQTSPQLNLVVNNYAAEGFVPVTDTRELQPGDGLLMATATPVVTHVGAYMGGGWFFHHAITRKSAIERWSGVWQATTLAIVRHPQAVLPPNPAVSRTAIDLLPDAKRRRYQQLLSGMTPWNPS